MMFAKRKIYIVILISCLMGCLFGIHASASEAVPEGLPEIARWECGGGYDRDGNRIIGVWAYDTVNEAGRYVLFDENGMVQKKADDWETRDQVEEYYTPTEQDSGTIALRSERFPGFDGDIYVTIGYENGVTRKFELSFENLYEYNVPAPQGVYHIQDVEAADPEYTYSVDYPKEELQMEKNGLIVVAVKVTSQKTGDAQGSENVSAADKQAEANKVEKKPMKEKIDIRQEQRTERSMDVKFMNAKHILLRSIQQNAPVTRFVGFGGALVLILTAGILLRNKKNKYQ